MKYHKGGKDQMDTKKAIEYLKRIKKIQREGIHGQNHFSQTNEIIELLQRGGKYEAMWEELHPHREGLTGKNYKSLGTVMWDIKQKYFPKPSKDFTEKVMKAINEGEAKDDQSE